MWFSTKFKKEIKQKKFDFDDNKWYLPKPYTNNEYLVFHFTSMLSVYSNSYDVYLLKTFLTGMLLDGMAFTTVSEYLNIITSFYVSTYAFKNVKNMSELELLNPNIIKVDSNIYMPIEFLNFIIENNFIDKTNTYLMEASGRLSGLYVNNIKIDENRDLPPNSHIAMFQYYLHKFEREEKDKNLIQLFYPLIIWWHLSLLIPLRASEITFMMDRNCIFEMNNKYYIRINRIKSGLIKKNAIPILKKICIDSKTYKLISDYQSSIDDDSTTKSLLSILKVRDGVNKLYEYNSYFSVRSNLFLRTYKDYSRFEATDMNQLISLFYDYYINIVNGVEPYYIKLRCGDTRHLSFSSLFLQNLNPIDIAMIGGHTSLRSLDSYIYHVDMYIDSEAYKYSNHISYEDDFDKQKLKNIIDSMIPAGEELKKAYPDEMGIGFCTSETCECEDDICFFCSHWWCRNTNSNYIKASKYLLQFYKNKIKDQLTENKQILATLIHKASLENINGTMILSDEYYSKYKEIIKRISSLASRKELIKSSLEINFSDERMK